MKQILIAPVISCRVSNFKNDKQEDVTFAKVTLLDEDAVSDDDRFSQLSISKELSDSVGFSDPDTFREVIGNPYVFEGRKIYRWDATTKTWNTKFKVDLIRPVKTATK